MKTKYLFVEKRQNVEKNKYVEKDKILLFHMTVIEHLIISW